AKSLHFLTYIHLHTMLKLITRYLHIAILLCACALQAPASAQVTAKDANEIGIAAMERGHYSTAMRAWLDPAKSGDAFAQSNIGYLYEHGLGVRQSYVEALEWYRRAANQNLAQAQLNIGTLYFYGYGVERNAREAVRWFRQSAKQDLKDAQYMMGVAHFEGQGAMASAPIALEWFVKASKQNHPNAQLMAANMYINGDTGKVDAFAAHVWADLAALGGNTEASLVRDYASFKLERSEIATATEVAKQCLATAFKTCL
ncbi:MAG: tetratricopeptide repeat protein, partial [Burkholderiaceae bacterium]